jgi:hypothetical protein
MVNDDGVFEIEIIKDGVPGVFEPTVAVVRGTLSAGALSRFRALTSKGPAELAAPTLAAAAKRRFDKEGGRPGEIMVTRNDFAE